MIYDCTQCEYYDYKKDLNMWGHPCDLHGGCIKYLKNDKREQREWDDADCLSCEYYETFNEPNGVVNLCKIHRGFHDNCKDYKERKNELS